MDDLTQPMGVPPTLRPATGGGRFAWLLQWWSRGLWQKVSVVAAVLTLASCACCSGGLIFAATPQGQQFAAQADATSTAQALADAQATARASAYALAHPSPTASAKVTMPPTATAQPTATPRSTATPVRTATKSASAGGYPHAGGPLSNFIAAYGQPFGHGGGGSDNFYADQAQSIILNVTFTNNIVSQVSVLGPTSWNNQQTFAYCTQFLPNDATEFNSDPPYTDYHSSAGEAIIENLGQGTCLTYMA